MSASTITLTTPAARSTSLRLPNQIALQFEAVSERLKGLLEENESLNQEMLQSSESARNALLERSGQISVIERRVEEGLQPVSTSDAERLQNEIESMQKKIKELVLKTKEVMQKKVDEKKRSVAFFEVCLKKEKEMSAPLEEVLAACKGEEKCFLSIKAAHKAKLHEIRSQKISCIEDIKDLARRIAPLIEAEIARLQIYIPLEHKGTETPETLKKGHIIKYLKTQQDWLKTFLLRVNCYPNTNFDYFLKE